MRKLNLRESKSVMRIVLFQVVSDVSSAQGFQVSFSFGIMS